MQEDDSYGQIVCAVSMYSVLIANVVETGDKNLSFK